MRYENWQERFWVEMQRQTMLPFVWGERDCILFAATMGDAISVDGNYVARARSAFKWKDERQALRLLGKATLAGMVSVVLGAPGDWRFCTHGDFVLIIDENKRECLTVHDGNQLIGPRDDSPGLKHIPFRYASCGWRIA